MKTKHRLFLPAAMGICVLLGNVFFNVYHESKREKLKTEYVEYIKQFYPKVDATDSMINSNEFLVYSKIHESTNFTITYSEAEDYLKRIKSSEETAILSNSSVQIDLCTLAYSDLFYEEMENIAEKIVPGMYQYELGVSIQDNELAPKSYVNKEDLLNELKDPNKYIGLHLYLLFDESSIIKNDIDLAVFNKSIIEEIVMFLDEKDLKELFFVSVESGISKEFSEIAPCQIEQMFINNEGWIENETEIRYPDGVR